MLPKVKSQWTRRRWLPISVGAVLAGSVSLGALRLSSRRLAVPTAEVKRGEFVDYLQLRGELKALRTRTVNAPSRSGSDPQIIKLAPNGGQVKKGDVVVQFDTTKLQQDLAQNRSALKAAEAEIEQSRAQARLTQEQDTTELMKARYELEAARLDASKQEIVSKIEGEEARLKVADAEQKLREAEAKLKSDQAAAAADLADKEQKRDKALFDAREAERQIGALTLRAPIDGMVTLLRNWRSGFFGGAPEFKEGDRAWSGAAIAELPDLSTLRVDVRADETDRSRLNLGQTVTVRVDAVPDQEFTARVATISTLATTDYEAGWPFRRNFDLEIEMERIDPRLRPGMNSTARVAVDRFPHSILIPTPAAFEKQGESVAFVKHGSRFEMRRIEVGRRGEGQLLVTSGLKPGERVALEDPTQKQ